MLSMQSPVLMAGTGWVLQAAHHAHNRTIQIVQYSMLATTQYACSQDSMLALVQVYWKLFAKPMQALVFVGHCCCLQC